MPKLRRTPIAAVALLFLVAPVGAQKSGSSAKVTIGTVAAAEPSSTQSEAAKGALVGGVLGYQLTSSSKSKSRKRRNAALGAVAGGAAKAASEDRTAMLYTIELGPGSMIKVLTDQTEIRVGDCVAVEEVRDSANVRRLDPSACTPSGRMAAEELSDELDEEATECQGAKEQLLAAEDESEVELAMAKVKILCND